MIDAGHGGKDPGNLGTGRYKWREKDVSLDVALRTGQYIKEQFPEINVMYTRETDVFIGLNERADIANSNQADIFISIHCNAIQYPSARGVETYALGLHKNDENLQVAMKENAAIKLEEDYEQKYEGFDPNSPESIIALTMMQSAFLDQSLRISSYIQKQFKERVGRRDRGVKQAGFLVLRRTTMPSILIELGFLTNPEEEDFLNSESGRIYMASAILRGFKEYKSTVEDPIEEGKEEETAKQEEEPKEISVELRQAELRAELERKKVELAKQKGIDLAAEEARKAKEDSLRIEAEKKAAAEKAAAEAKRLEAERIAEQARLKELADAEAARLEQEAAMAEAERKAVEDSERVEEEKKAQEAAAEAARLENERKLAELKAEQERLAAEKAETDRLAEQQRIATEKAEAEKKAEQERLEREKQQAEQERLAEENAAKEAKQAEIREILETEQAEKNAQTQEQEDPEAARVAAENAAKLEELRKKKAEVEARLAKLKEQGSETSESPQTSIPEQQTEIKQAPESSIADGSGLVFRVQIHTATNQLEINSSLFRDVPVWEYEQGGLFKYTTGEFKSVEEATPTQSRMRNLGFKGAFVVAFMDGQRIKVSEARKLLNK